MPKNLLILRDSPDWSSFDIERSRDFLRSVGLPETLIVDFAALWRRCFRVEYRAIRAQLKIIALQTYKSVRQASLVRHEDWDRAEPAEGWIAFVDDDDWMSPGLFDSLPVPASGDDGVRWGSIRLGRVFKADGYAGPIVQLRPIDRVVYTNNYAVTRRALDCFGRTAFFDHGAAQKAFDRSDFALTESGGYLSCAVKHPCCTMSINYLMSLESFRSDPRREMANFMEAIDAVHVNGMDEWLREPFRRFREVMADGVGPG